MTTQTKIIPGFNSAYLVLPNGTIYSNYSNKTLSSTDNGNGYFNVKLQKPIVDGVKVYKTLYVHRLVAEAFIPNPNNLPQVNHIDGNKANNTVSNLEWVTAQQNTQHAIATNLTALKQSFIPSGELAAVLTALLSGANTTQELALQYGYDKTSSFNTTIKKYAKTVGKLSEVLTVLKYHTTTARSATASSSGSPVYGINVTTGLLTEVFTTKSAAAKFCGSTVVNITTAIKRNSYAKGYFWFDASNGRPSQQCDDNKVS